MTSNLHECKMCFIKLRCDSHFQRAFTLCVFKVITLVGTIQGNCFENATASSKGSLKTTVATQLNHCLALFVWSALASVIWKVFLISN